MQSEGNIIVQFIILKDVGNLIPNILLFKSFSFFVLQQSSSL